MTERFFPFSSRAPREMTPNRITRALERKHAGGARVLDLTVSNPTRAGFDYPTERIRRALDAPGALDYAPDPKGLPEARDAIVAYYRRRAVAVDERQIVLTSSTSEAYALLFKLLADPGDRVSVPAPSYPLFEHLARAEGVEPVFYDLSFERGAWALDVDAIRGTVGDRTRAIVVVSPNNPTGSTLKRDELDRLTALCADRNVAVICDEVFADYVFDDRPDRVRSVADERRALVFALSGLSKVAALPQLKLGWIVANGPPALLDAALERLEFVADLYLSVATPVQRALPELLALASATRRRIVERIEANGRVLDALLTPASACRRVPTEGGWTALVQVPRFASDEEIALALLERDDVLVQPGYFFDFDREGWIVVSLLTPPDAFAAGARRMVERLDGGLL